MQTNVQRAKLRLFKMINILIIYMFNLFLCTHNVKTVEITLPLCVPNNANDTINHFRQC